MQVAYPVKTISRCKVMPLTIRQRRQCIVGSLTDENTFGHTEWRFVKRDGTAVIKASRDMFSFAGKESQLPNPFFGHAPLASEFEGIARPPSGVR